MDCDYRLINYCKMSLVGTLMRLSGDGQAENDGFPDNITLKEN